MPVGMIGASLLFTSAFVLTNGIEMMASRMLDARRVMTIGAAVLVAPLAQVFPGFLEGLPDWLQPLLNTPLVVGMLVALSLNLLFRIGVARRCELLVDPALVDSMALQRFMEGCGVQWGARADVVRRAGFALGELVETLARDFAVVAPMLIEARFDEFHIDVRVAYAGALMPLPARRSSFDEIADSPDGGQRLAGFMIRHYADRVRTDQHGEMTFVDLQFDH